MPERLFPGRLLLGALLLLATTAQAQQTRWYKVELLVFSQEGGQYAERWEATPELGYPGAARFLIDPARVDRAGRSATTASSVDEFGRQLLKLPSTDIPQRLPTPLENTTAGSDSALQGIAVEELNEDSSALIAMTPTPFRLLPRAQLAFRGKAAYMERSGRYRVLFHESWTQTMEEEAETLPIILDHSGDDGTWPQLQGSLMLYVSTYLYLQTDLWLNTNGEYLSGDWRMPPPPLGPPSVIVEEPMPAAQTFASESFPVQGEEEYRETSSDDETAALVPSYPFRHAVRLQQKRRMRSNEVHYLDHPMLGLVMKVTPLGSVDLEELAALEATTGQ